MTDSGLSFDPALQTRLRRALEGEALFDAFSRGRYSTDASIYQIDPLGVVIPRTPDDISATLAIARDAGVPVTPRGAGTSQCGQSIGRSLIVDTTKHLHDLVAFDLKERTVSVEPGVVVDQLNAFLERYGLMFPVDPATSSRATLGGMAGNNSAGSRSIRYGLMVDNVVGIEALLADGEKVLFGPDRGGPVSDRVATLARALQALHEREAAEIARRFPQVLRNVAGYNLNRLPPSSTNLAEILVGSEGTLAFFTRLQLKLEPLPAYRALGVCHFPSLRAAMDATPHVVTLEPSAVELVDHTLIGLARRNVEFRSTVDRFLAGAPEAVLLVEFIGSRADEVTAGLDRLDDLLGTLGLHSAVLRATDPAFQSEIWSVRKAGLGIAMSMVGDTKPIAFVEDCAVPLDRLGEYTDRLDTIFAQHQTVGIWYGHASVGCLHVRPALNLKDSDHVIKLRAIAEEVHEVVREMKGSHSGEHGDGILRSEFLEPMLGAQLVRAFEEVKKTFDPADLLNPGRIVRPPRMDDRTLFRYHPAYKPRALPVALDWSHWGGLLGAVEMCNNNGACRKTHPGVMCPSYRVTRDEQHVTRGRANTLRLALTGQLGKEALTSDAMYETMDLCVGCKACRRECPTGVDMARMKVEFLHHYRQRHGVPWRERLVAHLPRLAPWAARHSALANLRNRSALLKRLTERTIGISAQRHLPSWRADVFRSSPPTPLAAPGTGGRVVLFVDTFNRYFEPDNPRAAERVLRAAGYEVVEAQPEEGGRPLCCGRTYLNAGLIDSARREGRRVVAALTPLIRDGVAVVGLEPSCLLTFRDEFQALFPPAEVAALGEQAMLLEEFLVRERAGGRLDLDLRPITPGRAIVHGHCHQKAFGAAGPLMEALDWIPELEVEAIQSGCCGMAGAFGYESEHYDVSMQMAELDLLPAVRAAGEGAWIVADGTSCRRQIADGSGREAVHAARLLAAALLNDA